ncbi:putative non-specific polyamine oxidase transcription regulator Homeodomain-LIKE family [Helianthus annuus]|nr:putative non-specific polyamine oxidase transcription regulator Homeodomain-LIKE family [Helianthus annuus]
MNPPNDNQQQQQILPNIHNPLQFTIVLPHSDTTTNPNPNSNSPPSNPSNVNHLLSLGIPRKQRRGRPSSTQVYNLPNSFNNFQKNPNPRSNQSAPLDVSDEIIVINKEATSEALIALTAGFPADVLTEEEIDAGVVSVVGGIEQVNYILIRNHIITKWRENVLNWVTKEMFLDVVPSHCVKLLDSAYKYLVSHGYINFGVAPNVKDRVFSEGVSQDVSLGAALETFWQVDGSPANPEEMSLFNWHLANLEYANAGLLSRLSLAFWDQDDPYDMGGDHCFLQGGNGRLVQALAENVQIHYEKTVNAIRYGSDGVQVVVNGGQVFEGDVALCTVPLGVLKSGSIKFTPELPQRKLDGIKRLGFGLLNKVAMLFPHLFWGTDLDMFGHLSEDPSRRGEFFLFYSYATVAGGPVLMALVAGEAAHSFESMPPTDAVTRILQILRGIYEPQGIEVPEPIQTVCTRWGSDPFSLGSYSNVAVGSSGDDYDILAESVGDGRLFFAGEATTRRYPATMHGAFLSGLREAANIAHYATNRASQAKVEKKSSKNSHSCATLLADLFREPDLEFGSFSVIYTKKNADDKSMAVLRVVFSGPVKKAQEGSGSRPDQQHSNNLLFQQLQSHFNQQQELHVYTLLSREQVFELREVKGGDEMRLNFLCEKLGVKLVGRKGLGPAADDVISSIKAERSKRKPALTSSTPKSGTLKPKSVMKQKLVRKAKILRSNNSPFSSVNKEMIAKADGSNEGSSTTQLNQNVVAFNGSPGGGAPVKLTVNGANDSVPSVSTGPGLITDANCSPSLSVGSGVIGDISNSNATSNNNMQGVSAHDGDLVPTSNAKLDGEMQ